MTEEAQNKGGRPRKIATPELFDEMVDRYVAECVADEQPITWTGMALALGFTSREAIDEYANYSGFSDSVKRAKLLVARAYENRLHGNSPTGAIFALKNMGWSDRQELDHRSSDGSMTPTRIELVGGNDAAEQAAQSPESGQSVTANPGDVVAEVGNGRPNSPD